MDEETFNELYNDLYETIPLEANFRKYFYYIPKQFCGAGQCQNAIEGLNELFSEINVVVSPVGRNLLMIEYNEMV
jgi:hypothetical protein